MSSSSISAGSRSCCCCCSTTALFCWHLKDKVDSVAHHTHHTSWRQGAATPGEKRLYSNILYLKITIFHSSFLEVPQTLQCSSVGSLKTYCFGYTRVRTQKENNNNNNSTKKIATQTRCWTLKNKLVYFLLFEMKYLTKGETFWNIWHVIFKENTKIQYVRHFDTRKWSLNIGCENRTTIFF